MRRGPLALNHLTNGPAAGRSFFLVQLPNTVATVPARISLLCVLLLLSGCGGSGSDGRIDAGNAKQLEPSRAGVVLGPSRAADASGRVELLAPSGKLRVSAASGMVRLLDAQTGATFDTLVSRIVRPSAIAWTHDSRTFAVGGADGRVTIWDEFRHRTYELSAGGSPVTALAFSPDMRLLVSGQRSRGVRIWDLAKRKEVAALGPYFVVTRVRFTADGRRILLAGEGTSTWQLKLPR
jgi:WD40 repeat protein